MVIGMRDWAECAVYYPLIRHPLFDEKEELKRKYIALMKKYAEKYEIEEKRVTLICHGRVIQIRRKRKC